MSAAAGGTAAAAAGWPLLRSCAPATLRWTTATMTGLFLAGGLAAAYADAPDTVVVLLLSLPATLPWSMWFPRLLLLRLEADAARVPLLAAAVHRALAVAVAASVLVPAAILLALGTAPGTALAAPAVAAAAALLGALLPMGVYIGIFLLPWVWLLLRGLVHALPELQAVRPDWLHWSPQLLPWLALALAVAGAWRWRAIVGRGADDDRPAWLRPAVMCGSESTAWAWGIPDLGRANRADTQLPDWFWPAGQVGRAGPEHPSAAMRALLGTPFAPLSRRQLAVQAGFVVLTLVALAGLAGADGGEGWLASFSRGMLQGGMMGGLAAAAGVLVGMFGGRLELVMRKPSAELAEFSLLPGLGAPPAARRALLRAALRPPLAGLGVGTAVLLALVAAADIGAAGIAWLLVACAGVGVVALLACLRPLAGQRMLPWWMLAMVTAAVLLLIATAAVATGDAGSFGWWLGPPWALLMLGTGLGIRASWRRLHARAHPFLLP